MICGLLDIVNKENSELEFFLSNKKSLSEVESLFSYVTYFYFEGYNLENSARYFFFKLYAYKNKSKHNIHTYLLLLTEYINVFSQKKYSIYIHSYFFHVLHSRFLMPRIETLISRFAPFNGKEKVSRKIFIFVS